MGNVKTSNREKLEQRCAALAEVIAAIRPVYSNASEEQRSLIETMIGAALWYLPKAPQAWTGHISMGVLQAYLPDSGLIKPKFSEEHAYPRKIAARRLLELEDLDAAKMTELYLETYGRLHYITSEENKRVQQFQRASVFTTPDEAYAQANVILIPIAQEDMREIKRRNSVEIQKYLQSVSLNSHETD